MPLWSDPSDLGNVESSGTEPSFVCPYAVSDTIYSADVHGTVVSVDICEVSMGVVWSDGDGDTITYPIDATYLRKKYPWE